MTEEAETTATIHCLVDDRWDVLDAAGNRFAIVDQEGYSSDPLAIFRSREDAERYLRWQTEELPEDDRLPRHMYIVLEVRRIEGVVWNSYDPSPDETPTVELVEERIRS